jgi:Sec-independent protein translocase protein TatA
MGLQDIKNAILTKQVAAFTAVGNLWNKAKDYIMAILALIAVLLYGYEKIQSNKVKSLQNQIDNMKTKEEVAALQTQINQEIANATAAGQQADSLQALATQLAQKSAALQSNANSTDLANSFNEELK